MDLSKLDSTAPSKHQEANSDAHQIERSQDAEFKSVELSDSPPQQPRNMYVLNLAVCKEILHAAGGNEKCHRFLEDKLRELQASRADFIKAEFGGKAQASGIIDTVCVPRNMGLPSSKRAKYWYESRVKGTSRPVAVDGQEDSGEHFSLSRAVVDVVGKQKGKRAK